MNTLRIAIACFLGAFIGSIVALQFGPELWWLGSIAGAAIGYLTYRFEDVAAAIPVAWREVISWRWQPDRPWWRAYRASIVEMFNLGSIEGSITAAVFMPLLRPEHRVAVLICGSLGGGVVLGLLVSAWGAGEDTEKLLRSNMHTPNLFRFWFWSLPRGVVRFIGWVFKYSFMATAFTAGLAIMTIVVAVAFAPLLVQLTKTVFRIIHSELRLLCAADAALGAAIGYFVGNALVGGVAGSLLGILNYEVVSVRMLKLAEARSIFHR